jgi:hypothetical protein
MQAVALDTEYDPLEHTAQDVAPGLEYVPPAHAAHVAAC